MTTDTRIPITSFKASGPRHPGTLIPATVSGECRHDHPTAAEAKGCLTGDLVVMVEHHGEADRHVLGQACGLCDRVPTVRLERVAQGVRFAEWRVLDGRGRRVWSAGEPGTLVSGGDQAIPMSPPQRLVVHAELRGAGGATEARWELVPTGDDSVESLAIDGQVATFTGLRLA